MLWFRLKHALWDAFTPAASLAYWAIVRAPWRALARPRTLAILNYHGVEAGEAASFERQLQFLRRRRWRFLTLDEVLAALEGGPLPARAAHVTFDDALQSVADHAAPVLRRLDVPATVFVPTGLVEGPVPPGKRPPMDWRTIRELDGPRLRFECHGQSHRFLDSLPEDDIRRELAESRRTLAGRLGREVQCVAYPGSRVSRTVKRIARECGYRAGFTAFTHTDQTADPFEVRRLPLLPTTSLLRTWLLVEGGYNWYAPLSRLRQAWRRKRS